MGSDIVKEYTNGEITVFWDPNKCIHSAECLRSQPGVFDVHKSPWISMGGATSEEIMAAIDRCPSGALSYKRNEEVERQIDQEDRPSVEIKVVRDGPLLVRGRCALVGEEGEMIGEEGPFALCRCGRSAKKPFCDGSHRG